ncbi:MAG: hypothetical protein ACRBCJ_12025 [Hyphomicrobiaceae bacterium]
MSTANKRRGRPKGSGIDDTERLQEIAARICAEPNLKPTTAIKAMGITDPSSIRRLRDKFKKFSAAQASPKMTSQRLRSAAREVQAINRPTRHEVSVSAALAQKKDPTKQQETSSARRKSKKPDNTGSNRNQQSSLLAMEASPPLDIDWVASWCSSNLGTMSDVMEAQLAVTQSMLSVPYFAMALRQQIALNAFALSVLPSGYRRRTLH